MASLPVQAREVRLGDVIAYGRWVRDFLVLGLEITPHRVRALNHWGDAVDLDPGLRVWVSVPPHGPRAIRA